MSGQEDDVSTAARFPSPPDAASVNSGWDAVAIVGGGLRGALARIVSRLLGPQLAGQSTWNARQVQLDNAMLAYLRDHFAATHAHYDALLASLGRRLDEADTRHRQLEQELLRHVSELVERIDLVLLEANRGRLETKGVLLELQQRLRQIEQALRERSG